MNHIFIAAGATILVWAMWREAHHGGMVDAIGYSASAEVCDDPAANNSRRILSDEQLASYREDGFIVMKGVLREEIANQMALAGRAFVNRASRFPQFFSVIESGLIFDGGGAAFEENNKTQYASIFRHVALYSVIPRIAAELMELDRDDQNLRVLKDMFLAKPVNESGCDFHVDDHGFWGESYLSEASRTSGKDQDGVNAWIALEDMPAMYQGSMAVAAGSHKAPWRFEAYEALGQNRSVDGGHSKEEIIAKLEKKRKSGDVALGACDIGRIRPDLKAKLEAQEVVLDIERGDIIFATRTLFHKTIDVTPEGREFYKSKGLDVLNRYSIRYTTGTAKLPNGWLAEWSAVVDKSSPGKSLNDVVGNVDEPDKFLWYPQVWPNLDQDMDHRLDLVASTVLNRAKKLVQAEIIEIFAPKPSVKATVETSDLVTDIE